MKSSLHLLFTSWRKLFNLFFSIMNNKTCEIYCKFWLWIVTSDIQNNNCLKNFIWNHIVWISYTMVILIVWISYTMVILIVDRERKKKIKNFSKIGYLGLEYWSSIRLGLEYWSSIRNIPSVKIASQIINITLHRQYIIDNKGV